jgi:hypothetical protein
MLFYDCQGASTIANVAKKKAYHFGKPFEKNLLSNYAFNKPKTAYLFEKESDDVLQQLIKL